MNNKTLAICLLRISFGINFFFHGIVRLPNLDKFVSGMQSSFHSTFLPNILVTPMAYAIPISELIIGLLLIINKFTRNALVASFILMNILIIGSSVLQNWESVAVKVTYIGFLFLLLYFTKDNQISKEK